MSVINRPELATSYLAMNVECVQAYSVAQFLRSDPREARGFDAPVKVVLVNDCGNVVYDSFIHLEACQGHDEQVLGHPCNRHRAR